MSTTAAIVLAEKFISLIAETDTYRHCETIAPGRYVLSDATAEGGQATTAAMVVAGVFAWAAETLDDMTSKESEVAVASAVLSSRFDDALELGNRAGDQVSLEIWSRVILFAARSGHVATLHSPSGSETEDATVVV